MDNYSRSLQNGFTAHAFDRKSHKRSDADWISKKLRVSTSRFLPIWKLKNFVSSETVPRPIVLLIDEVEEFLSRAASIVLLGEKNGSAYFAVDISEESESLVSKFQERGEFQDLRKLGALLDRNDGALLAYSRAMVHWHQRSQFCGSCGSRTRSADAGHTRICVDSNCSQQHFPRTDPAVIVLISRDDLCLLGRQTVWPKGMYSAIAGFVEPGETLEEAVIREAFEETGVTLSQVFYHSSQPWPFPASIMLGFTATASSCDIYLKDQELEDARWFTREELAASIYNDTMRLPSAYSIAYRLIEDWFDANAHVKLKDIIGKR